MCQLAQRIGPDLLFIQLEQVLQIYTIEEGGVFATLRESLATDPYGAFVCPDDMLLIEAAYNGGMCKRLRTDVEFERWWVELLVEPRPPFVNKLAEPKSLMDVVLDRADVSAHCLVKGH